MNTSKSHAPPWLWVANVNKRDLLLCKNTSAMWHNGVDNIWLGMEIDASVCLCDLLFGGREGGLGLIHPVLLGYH